MTKSEAELVGQILRVDTDSQNYDCDTCDGSEGDQELEHMDYAIYKYTNR